MAYVAFPHRGEDVPGVPWLGDAMGKAVDALPTLDEESPTPTRAVPIASPPRCAAPARRGAPLRLRPL